MPSFFPNPRVTFNVESCSNMVVKHPSFSLGLKLDLSSNLGFFWWKVNNFGHWKLLKFGGGKPNLQLLGPRLDPSSSLGGFCFLKNEQLSELKVAQLWWGKTWYVIWVQNWMWVATLVFFFLLKSELPLALRVVHQWWEKTWTTTFISNFMNKLMLLKVEFVMCWK
jgi:hypothetical protein